MRGFHQQVSGSESRGGGAAVAQTKTVMAGLPLDVFLIGSLPGEQE